ncbi:hypothetical protein HY419_00975 [candidate division WWE3 bacterium]|nr:hypothetical protein [candidate division WWE3 bacterium]
MMLKSFATSRLIPLLVLLVVFAANTFYASAHVDVEGEAPEDIEVTIVEPDLFPAKTPLTVWLEVKAKETNQTEKGLDISVSVEDSKENEFFKGKAQSKNLKGGQVNYIFDVTFPSGGEYKIIYEFTHEKELEKFAFPITASEPVQETGLVLNPPLKTGVIAGGALFLVVAIWLLMAKRIKELLILAVVALVSGIVGYSLLVTINSGALKSGVVTCLEDGRCFWTAHIHTYIAASACGEEKLLPAEVGPLAKVHTHEEQNVFHWHDRLPYDLNKKEITDTKALTLGSSFSDVGIAFDKGGAFDLKDGDKCPDGKEGQWKMFVNGKQSDKFRDYVWQDRDIIILIFDDRSPSEIEESLRINPIKFPALGRG